MDFATGAELQVGNEDLLISGLIERCPKLMMPQELTKNAVEAVARNPGDRLIEISTKYLKGIPKRCLSNTEAR